MRIGALEAGGTKMVCAIGNEKGKIIEKMQIPTSTPKETMPQIVRYFKDREIEALGIGAFGPVSVCPEAENYGEILDTPKLAWRHFNFVSYMKKELGIPVNLDTDVNGSCLGEMTYGCAKGLDSVIYITIGTGIGCGIAVGGKLLHGMLHPEAGHIMIKKRENDISQCVCPYHESCFEGLASGPAIEKRYGKKAIELKDRKDVWELESDYIAEAATNYILILSPQKIILGGGVMHQEQLFPLIRKKVLENLSGYLNTKELRNIEDYIVPASLNDDQGILGALKLGLDKVNGKQI